MLDKQEEQVVRSNLLVARLGVNVGINDHILTEELSTINEGIPWGYIDQ